MSFVSCAFSLLLFLVADAHGFSRKPTSACETDIDCVLVRTNECGDARLFSIRMGQDEEWARWMSKSSKNESEKSSTFCEGQKWLDPRLAEAHCQQGSCAVREKKQKPDRQ